MAVTTMQNVIDGLKPPIEYSKSTHVPGGSATTSKLVTSFYAVGNPTGATAPASGTAGTALTSYTGQLAWQNPASGAAYLAGIMGGHIPPNFSGMGIAMLADRLWHNAGITVTTTIAQGINSVTWPARDRNGATAGDGVVVALEVSTALGNGSAVTNTTISYTNSDGTAGRTGTLTSGIPSTGGVGPGVGAILPFELASGDIGVQSIQSITLGTSLVSGTVHLIAFRPIFFYSITGINRSGRSGYIDAIGCGLPRIYNDSVLFWMGRVPATNAQIAHTYGMIQATHG